MRIEYLQYFLNIAETQSFSASAQKLFLSQQGLSDAIKRLEKEIGLTLFYRGKNGTSLTAEGQRLYEQIQTIVREYNILEKDIAELKESPEKVCNKEIQQLRILVNPLVSAAILPDLLELSEKEYPELQFFCTDTVDFEEALTMMANGVVDACIFMLMEVDEEILQSIPNDVKIYKLFEDQLVACMNKDGEMAKRKFLTQEQIDSAPKILFNGIYSTARSGMGNQLGVFNYSVGVNYVSNNLLFQLQQLLRNPNMLAFTSNYFSKKTFNHPDIVALPIDPPLKESYYIMLPNVELCEDTKSFLRILERYIHWLTKQNVSYRELLI